MMRNNSSSPVPIKSSMALIIDTDQTWSTSVGKIQKTSASRHTGGETEFRTRSRGDCKELSAIFSDIPGFSVDQEMFNTFTERLVQNFSAKTKRTADRRTFFRNNDQKTKKSRQIFTMSRPTNSEQPGRPLDEGTEIYESFGGGVGKETEGALQNGLSTVSQEKVRQDALRVPLPQLTPPKENLQIDPTESDSSCDTQIFIPDCLSTPNPGTCFPRTKSQPHLYYTTSDQSMPPKSCSSAQSLGDAVRISKDRPRDEYFAETENCQLSCKPGASCRPRDSFWDSKPFQFGSSLELSPYEKIGHRHFSETNPNEEIYLGYQELNDFLSEKMAKTLMGLSIMPARGRLMSYAKFNSSFRITEDVYEDSNCRSISRLPSVSESLPTGHKGQNLSVKNLDYVHKLNPDFDENQSLTEALTSIKSPYQSSSFTSIGLRSDLFTKVYRRFTKPTSIDELSEREEISWIRTPEAVLTQSQNSLISDKKPAKDEVTQSSFISQLEQKSDFVDLSNDSGSHISLSRVVSAIRRQRLTELKISLNNAKVLQQRETDLRSRTSSSPVRSDLMEIMCSGRVSRKNLCDVISQTGVFNNSSVELFKRPLWRLKLSQILDERRTKLLHDFVSKAHHYMCGKDYHRTALNRCFFRATPAVRLSDRSTQFPDYSSRIFDRLGDIEKPEEDDVVSVETAMYCQIVHENCSIVQETDENPLDHFELPSLEACYTEKITDLQSGDQRGFATCHKRISRISVAEMNRFNVPKNSTIYYHTESNKVQEPQGLVQLEEEYNAQKDEVGESQDQSAVCQQDRTPVSHSFRALCDKRRIRIKYENGKYTVYKEVDHSRKRTVWSLLTGKATNLLNIVLPKKPHQNRSSRHHKVCN